MRAVRGAGGAPDADPFQVAGLTGLVFKVTP
jgi:hypothetical protein